MTCEAMKQALEPIFWYRPVCNGEMYEGPVHSNSVGGKMLRDEKPGEWLPLYAHPPALSQPSPAWHDAPTGPGLWICDEASDLKYEWRAQRVTWPMHSLLLGEGERWYGPIPEDK